MTWSVVPWSEGPWSGPVLPAAPPQQVIPPPIPDGTPSYTYGVAQGSYPWSYGGWSGGVAPFTALAGGIVAAPNPLAGTVSVYAWWPYSPTLQLVRTGPDGVRVPVRGGYPVTPAGLTLINYATNPNSIATTGYVPGTGSPTLSLLSRTDSVGGTAVRAANASSGTNEVTVPQSLTAAPLVTAALDLQLSAKATSLTVTLAWVDGAGGALSSTAFTLSASQIAAAVGQFSRIVFQVSPPVAAATCSTLKVNAGGMPAGGTVDMDRWKLVAANDDGAYGDGDSLGGQWAGTSGLSTSILAPVAVVSDGECPLDVACSYTLYAPILTGGYARTPTITLASNDVSWLTHPATPGVPLACVPRAVPDLEHDIDQGVFQIVGSRYPVVVSSSTRLAPAGTLELHAQTFADRAALMGLLADGSALLLRAPASYGYGLGMWIAAGKLSEAPTGAYAQQQGRLLSFPFQQVSTPAGPNMLVA